MKLFLLQNPSKLDQLKYEHQIYQYGSIRFSMGWGWGWIRKTKRNYAFVQPNRHIL
jgi:hypothetical protein